MPEFSVTVTVPEQTQTVTFPEQKVTAAITVDMSNLRTLLRLAGWPEDKVDLGQAIATAEAGGKDANGIQFVYSDAVGDLTLTNQVWGPSIGMFQIRAYRYPMTQYQSYDIWRWAYPLTKPFYNAQAALALSKNGTDFSPWSVFTSGSYQQYLGGDPVIRTGHSAAASWWK